MQEVKCKWGCPRMQRRQRPPRDSLCSQLRDPEVKPALLTVGGSYLAASNPQHHSIRPALPLHRGPLTSLRLWADDTRETRSWGHLSLVAHPVAVSVQQCVLWANLEMVKSPHGTFKKPKVSIATDDGNTFASIVQWASKEADQGYSIFPATATLQHHSDPNSIFQPDDSSKS